ncbi:hypothetical protein GCM10017567_35370 [Amycolatopsis bullii]|uniref:Uncharacterized protein n=1 Tax=Amycolatopsis bullii TaxID=941987 RepID=A0ABQ3KCU6_9PSEU|nr:hypothetical protein GCM10017567_35370 [Amycolatopsis bullii]
MPGGDGGELPMVGAAADEFGIEPGERVQFGHWQRGAGEDERFATTERNFR